MLNKKNLYVLKISEKNRKTWLSFYIPIIIIIVCVTAVAPTLGYIAMFTATPIKKIIPAIMDSDYFNIIAIALSAVLISRAYFTIMDFFRYEKIMGHKISLSYLLTYPVAMALFTLVYLLISSFVGLFVFWFSDIDLLSSLALLTESINHSLDYIHNKIPTIIELPKPVVIVVLFLLWTFLLYFFHRLGHASRIFWLLSHRPHHISTAVTGVTVFAADHDFVIGFIWKFIWAVLPMLASKLIYPEPIIFEFIIILCIWGCFDGLNHHSTYYESIMSERNLLLKVLKKGHEFFNTGPYHVLHHSSLPEHSMVNLCSHFFLWDRLGNTFCEPPKKLPTLGLTGQPLIHFTPSRLVFSGLLQIIYELRNNKGIGTKFKIIFGGIDYLPLVSKSFLKVNEVTKDYTPHLQQYR